MFDMETCTQQKFIVMFVLNPRLITVRLLVLCVLLQSTPRTGWVRCGVQKPESIADHMYRTATMAFLIDPRSDLSKDRCIIHTFVSRHIAFARKHFLLVVFRIYVC